MIEVVNSFTNKKCSVNFIITPDIYESIKRNFRFVEMQNSRGEKFCVAKNRKPYVQVTIVDLNHFNEGEATCFTYYAHPAGGGVEHRFSFTPQSEAKEPNSSIIEIFNQLYNTGFERCWLQEYARIFEIESKPDGRRTNRNQR